MDLPSQCDELKSFLWTRYCLSLKARLFPNVGWKRRVVRTCLVIEHPLCYMSYLFFYSIQTKKKKNLHRTVVEFNAGWSLLEGKLE